MENGEEPPVPELERPDIPSFKVKAEPLNQELKFSSHTEEEESGHPKPKKKVIRPKKLLFEIDDKFYSEIDHFFISKHNRYGCNDMLEIVFTYQDLQNKAHQKTGYLSTHNPGFILEKESLEKSCEHYKK